MILNDFKVSLYNCPWLEEVQLQDNRLTSLPAAIFTLESLSSLDVSNNKLQGPNSIGIGFWSSLSLYRMIHPDLDTTPLQEQKIAQLLDVWCRCEVHCTRFYGAT